MLRDALDALLAIDPPLLIGGLLIGVAAVFLVRARQVWNHRRAFGYSVYSAYTLRQRLVRLSLIALGALAVVGGGYLWLRGGQPTSDGGSAAALPAIDQQPARLFIPRLAVEAEIIEAPFVARQWDISQLRGEVAHLAGTAFPGDPGNAVLAGHITIPGAGWGPFQELDTLAGGDRVFIERGDATYVYEVFENRVVAPNAVEVAFPTEDDRLTLITCTDWDATLESYAARIVVVARLTGSSDD
jgi:LPXTG-site transpeptidase (sortase) family protein